MASKTSGDHDERPVNFSGSRGIQWASRWRACAAIARLGHTGGQMAMLSNLTEQLNEYGYQARVVSYRRLAELREGIRASYAAGLLNPAFYEERLAKLDYGLTEPLAEARSLIVVAVPQPQIRFTFAYGGRQMPVLVPPTYLHWRETDKTVGDRVSERLEPAGYRVVPALLPKKLLAAQSGLAAYGRNNITYVAGMGSFFRLVTFGSDLPCPHDDWQEPRQMDACWTCQACRNKCPTGAIPSERFLLYAEHCIVFHNERPGHVAFPAWLEPSAHNCLVGCLHCQSVCPANHDVLDRVEEGAAFSEQETALLLEAIPIDRLPNATQRKLEQWDLLELYDVMPRNLRALLQGEASTRVSAERSADKEKQ
jgi:epoxyqueuosine reductase